MAKRSLDNASAERPRKAPKKFAAEDAEPPPKIYSVRDLRQQLRFTQEDPERLRKGQFAFKDFLKSISDPKEEADRSYRLEVLKEYLDANPEDMLKAWSFAGQVDNERLVFAVATTFAQLLRTLSSLLDFKDYGLAVAKSLIQREQLKLLQRGLTAESHKQTIINACLQIVTEIVSFDGGSLAGMLFKNQDFIFNSKFLDRNLRLFVASSGGDRRETSVRAETIRYILAHLRNQDVETRAKIIDMRSVFRNLLDNIKSDPAHIVVDVLKTLETTVLKQQDIPRRLKSAIISDRALAAIVDHLRNDAAKLADDDAAGMALYNTTWSLLRSICTDPDLGVALPCSWYPSPKPKGDDDLIERSVFEGVDLRSIRNPILSKFAQHLKPHTSVTERELLMSIFTVAPELVADYLRQAGQRLTLLPKLTNTWIGYASLIFSIIDLPIPQYLGATDGYRSEPPPKENVLENILPAPLTREVLARCLNQSSSMIRFFALRIMVISLRKLKNLVTIYETAVKEHAHYEDAIYEIITDVLGRLPPIKDVALVYKNLPEDEIMSKEAAAHLLSLYQKLLPSTSAEDLFDVAPALAAVISSLRTDLDAANRSLVELQLTHLLQIAEHSQGMRWWQRPGTLPHSAFLTIVQLCADRASTAPDSLVHILETAAYDDGLLQNTTELSSLDALLASLEGDKEWKALPETWTFVDDCINRLIKRPIKYLDDLDALAIDAESGSAISMLVLVIAEQIPFTSRLEAAARDNILAWASRFLTALSTIGEDKQVIRKIKDDLKEQGFKLSKSKVRSIRSRADFAPQASSDVPETAPASKKSATTFTVTYTPIPAESTKHPELLRYKKLDLDDLINDGTLSALLLKPCSSFPEIRTQALTALSEIRDMLDTSSLDNKLQLWALVGELVETCRDPSRPLSWIAGSFATAALKVLLSPSHFMYPAVNRYLLKDPYWDVRKLPKYFLDRALLEVPDEDDKQPAVLEWVLTMLLEGIRTPEDVRLLRAQGVLERILNVVNGAQVSPAAVAAVYRLVYRVVEVVGSTGLVMEVGLLAWLKMAEQSGRFAGEGLKELKVFVEERMDRERVKEWRGY